MPTKSYKLDGLWTLNGCHCLAAPIVGNLFGGTLTTVTVTFTVTFTVTVTVTATAIGRRGGGRGIHAGPIHGLSPCCPKLAQTDG